ncbi:MAG: HU family DNA-binding protein [Pseudolabrys sp.]
MLDVTAPAKPTAPKAITIKILANELEEQHQLSKRQALKLIEDLIGMITKHLVVGERVKIIGLGILQVRNRVARMGRNPNTGEPIQIKASKRVAFRASKELKEAV